MMAGGLRSLYKKHQSVARFIFSGGVATTIDFICYYALHYFLDYSIAKLISILIANIWSYNVNKRWVFQSKTETNKMMVTQYVLCQVVNISANVAVNSVMVKMTNMIVLSFIVATACATVLNYLIQKLFVFRK